MEFPVRPIHRLEGSLSNDICHRTPPVILITNEPLSNERVVNFTDAFANDYNWHSIRIDSIYFQA